MDQAEVEVDVDVWRPESGDWEQEEATESVIGLPSSVIQILSLIISSFVGSPSPVFSPSSLVIQRQRTRERSFLQCALA
jgi:hypothetical protein